MGIIVLNCGSSSAKYQLIDSKTEDCVVSGIVEKIGETSSIFKYARTGHDSIKREDVKVANHDEAISLIFKYMTDKEVGVIKNMSDIKAIGHRLVHGGEKFRSSVIIDDNVLQVMEELSSLAPLHNPPNILGVRACQKLFPNVPQVGVFDTAFHSTMPEEAYLYGIPYEYYQKHHIKRYGFHGTSHRFVSLRCAELEGKKLDQMKIIVCHLGNGASVCAINKGKSVDTSMGMTPMEGLLMGTRCGDIDPGIIFHLHRNFNMNFSEIDSLLNKKSGVLGVGGLGNDMRVLEDKMLKEGERMSTLVHTIHAYRIKKYIGAYTAAMNGVDAIIFTGGVGENSPVLRKMAVSNMEFLGVNLDVEKNELYLRGKEGNVAKAESKVKVFVIPTNEELMIARDTKEIALKK